MTVASSGGIATDAVNRVLIPDSELAMASYSFSLEPVGFLTIDASFTNTTVDKAFSNIAFERVGTAEENNILASTEPVMTPLQLNGDDMLSPGETSGEVRFWVQNKGEPFTDRVVAMGDVEEELPTLQ